MTEEIGPLLSSTSLLLAAYGFFYNTQRDRIDAVIAEKRNDDVNLRRAQRDHARRVRNVARTLAAVAFLVWLLLLPEVVASVCDAFEPKLDLSDYSTPHVIFVVAATAWLFVGVLVARRAHEVSKQVKAFAD